MTAVFANSPGALQLLPNKEYGSGWLRLGMAWHGNYRSIVSLPKADPYEEIYKQRGPWWALVREELINPSKIKLHKGWKDYLTNIDIAAGFHTQLTGKYHPNTYSFHGDGKDAGNGLTWGRVGWFASMGNPNFDPGAAELLALRPLADDGAGQVSAAGSDFCHHFYLSPKDSAGDGTVPVHSGNSPASAGSKATYHLNLFGEGHEGAYRIDMAQRVTLHAILQIAQTVSILD